MAPLFDRVATLGNLGQEAGTALGRRCATWTK